MVGIMPNITFKRILAPMVEQCDLAFRMLVRKYNCDLCFTQMFHSTILSTKKDYFKQHFTTCDQDKPLVIQLCGNNPTDITNAAKVVLPYCQNVDLNLGCPQGIARKGGYGAFLLPDYNKIQSIVQSLHAESIPFSVKIRLLPSLSDTLRLCEMLQREGAQFITVHGRRKEQKRELTGECDWSAIKQIVAASSIPIIANGGIDSFSSAIRCIQETGVQGIMSGEALLENPTLFAPTVSKTVPEICMEYLQLEQDYPAQPKEIRKHLFKLLHRGLKIDIPCREKLALMRLTTKEDKEEVKEMINEIAIKMKQRGDEWLIQNSTILTSSWYRRYRSI